MGQISAQSTLADRLEDLRQETAVRLALLENAEFRSYDVTAEVADGVVVLSGLVPTLGARDHVVAYINSLADGRAVRSTLRLEGRPNEPLPEPVAPLPGEAGDVIEGPLDEGSVS